MFISNADKSKIESRLQTLETNVEKLLFRFQSLEARVDRLGRSLNALHDAKTLAPNPGQLKLRPAKKTQPKRNSGWTLEKRNAHSERMKQKWAAKAAAKAAAAQEAA